MAGFSIIIIFLFFIVMLSVITLYLIMSYTFYCISIMSMLKKSSAKKIYPAWIPFYNKYLLGKISENKAMGIISSILSLISIVLIICFFISKKLEIVLFITLVISFIITFILDTIISHKIYKICASKYAEVLTVFNVLTLGVLQPIFLFILRNKFIN